MIARILPDLSLDKEFDYLIPEEMLEELEVGCRVCIPFGKTTRYGYVTEILPDSAIDFPIAKAKPLKSNEGHLIPAGLLKLSYWIADYYCSKRIHTVRSLLPAPVRNDKVKTKIAKLYRLADDVDLKSVMPTLEEKTPQRALVIQCLLSKKEATAATIKRQTGVSDSPIKTLLKEGYTQKQIDEGFTLYKPKGCEKCSKGYKGRVGIYEVVKVTPAISQLIMSEATSLDIAKKADEEGFNNLRK